MQVTCKNNITGSSSLFTPKRSGRGALEPGEQSTSDGLASRRVIDTARSVFDEALLREVERLIDPCARARWGEGDAGDTLWIVREVDAERAELSVGILGVETPLPGVAVGAVGGAERGDHLDLEATRLSQGEGGVLRGELGEQGGEIEVCLLAIVVAGELLALCERIVCGDVSSVIIVCGWAKRELTLNTAAHEDTCV
tara:strand:- start:143 stop:736 length:594 start_codon:yes stop_codon:yes gene_type:complete